MNYYAVIDGKRIGPLTLSELKSSGISRQSLVWHEGMTDWSPAGTVDSLNEFFKETPPPLPGQERQSGATDGIPQVPRPEPPTSWLGWAIAATILGAFFYLVGAIPGIVGIIQSSTARNRYDEGDYTGARRAAESAKIWTIVGLCLAGIVIVGIVLSLIFIAGVFSFYF